MRTLALALTLTGLIAGTSSHVAAQTPAGGATDTLGQARRAYNSQQYDEAIRLATDAGRTPALTDAAAVVEARAHLERFRQTSEAGDLAAARTALTRVNDARLSPSDHIELTIGFGEALYFDSRFSAAAECFEMALSRPELLEPKARETLLEWWANALGQQAELSADPERRPLYRRILERSEEELRRDDRSAVAAYWLAAAARGASDLDRAWGAAQAGWVRAPQTGANAAKLRADLDRLVTLVIIPERALQLSSTGDARAAAAILQQEWQELKDKYKGS